MEVAGQVQEKEPEDNFEAAFAQIAAAIDGNADAGAIKQAVEDPGKAAEDTAAAAAKVEADAAAAKANEGKTPEQIAAEAGAAAEEVEETPEAKAEREAGERAVAAAAEKPLIDAKVLGQTIADALRPKEQPKPVEQQPQSPFTNDEIAMIAAVEKDFPDLVRAQRVERVAELKATTAYILGTVSKAIAPLFETMGSIANRAHLGDINAHVENYDTATRDGVLAWIETQPGYIKTAMQVVAREGTTDQIVDLIQRYRAETGAKIPGASGDGGAAAAAAAATADAAAAKVAQAAAALAPTKGKRTVSAPNVEATNYDDAWAQASAIADKL